MDRVIANSHVLDAIEALAEAMDRFDDKLPRQFMLAAAAQFCGQLLCLQDPETITSDMGMELIFQNIIEGNKVMALFAMRTEGSA